MSDNKDYSLNASTEAFNAQYGIKAKVKQKPELREDKTILSVRHLKQYFGAPGRELKAVSDVSFDVKEGECVGIVGESGCGKTTTGRSIIRLYDITSGSVYFKGVRLNAGTRYTQEQIKKAKEEGNTKELEIQKQKLKQIKYDKAHVSKKLASEIQMIFQDPIDSLDPRMTVEDIIQEGLRIQGFRNREENHKKVVEILNKVGLVEEHASRYPHEFSGGQRQRIGIARAIIMNPRLLICDEPISALDVSIRAQVINLLNDLKNEMNLSIIFIAHDLSVVKYFCDTIVVMYYGKIVEKAPADELFAHPTHPYTKALLSAIPKPNPITEQKRKRIIYNPATTHDYSAGEPTLREIVEGHFVLCDDAEFEKYMMEIKG